MQVFDVTGSVLQTHGKLEQLYYESLGRNRSEGWGVSKKMGENTFTLEYTERAELS